MSRERARGERTNVIKMRLRPDNLNIVDYGNVVEEIEADKGNAMTVDMDEIVGQTEPSVARMSETNASPDPEGAAKKAALEAYQKGFEAGQKEISKSLQEEFDLKISEVTESFDSLLREFAAEIATFDHDFDRAIITLALAIARRVVAREIEVDEGAVLARSREAVRKIIGVEKIKIHVNPADEEYIKGHRNELSTYADSVKEIVIEADGKVERGGCIIESELGNIDARVSTRFELIEESLLGVIK